MRSKPCFCKRGGSQSVLHLWPPRSGWCVPSRFTPPAQAVLTCCEPHELLTNNEVLCIVIAGEPKGLLARFVNSSGVLCRSVSLTPRSANTHSVCSQCVIYSSCVLATLLTLKPTIKRGKRTTREVNMAPSMLPIPNGTFSSDDKWPHHFASESANEVG